MGRDKPGGAGRLLVALYVASEWCAKPENRAELAQLLAQPVYVGRDAELLLPARHADVLLPSLRWGEKSGTVTNSERRISRQRGFLDASAGARADWWQLADVARRMGFAAAIDQSPADWADWCRQTLAIPHGVEPLGYVDRQTGGTRFAFFEGERLLAAFFLAREPVAVARNWAIAQLTAGHGNLRKRFALVAGRPRTSRIRAPPSAPASVSASTRSSRPCAAAA